jgi:DNA polymerase III subunit delta
MANMDKKVMDKRVVFLCGTETALKEERRQQILRQWQGDTAQSMHTQALAVDKAKDWQIFVAKASAQSLFQDKIVLYIKAKIASMTSISLEHLTGYLGNPCPNKYVLIEWIDWQKKDSNRAWFKKITQIKTLHIVTVDSVPQYQFESWLRTRMRQLNYQISYEAMQHLLAACEGNLTAAAQWIDQLAWIQQDGEVSDDLVKAMVGNRAQYSAYTLVDAAMLGQSKKVHYCFSAIAHDVSQIMSLQAVLMQTLRQLVDWSAQAKKQQKSHHYLLSQEKMWASKQKKLLASLDRHSFADLKQLLWLTCHASIVHRGLLPGDSVVLLEAVLLQLSGTLPVDYQREQNSWMRSHSYWNSVNSECPEVDNVALS